MFVNGNLPWYSVADLCSGCSFAVRLTIGATWVNGPWHTPGNYTIDIGVFNSDWSTVYT